MRSEEESELRTAQLVFIGKILANFSHEIRNYLAIIRESAGLMCDLIELGKSQEKNQYTESLHSINTQVERSLSLLRYFTRFAHGMDTRLTTFNINEALEDLLALMDRLAKQRRVSLEKNFGADIPAVYSDPTGVLLVIFCLIDENLKRLDRDSRITIETSFFGDRLRINVVAEGNVLSAEEKGTCSDEMLRYLIGELGGDYSKERGKAEITLPLKHGM